MIHFSLKLKAGAQSKQASTYSSNPKFKAKETYYLNTETHPASLLSLDLEDLKSEIGGKGAGLFEMPALVETLKIVLAQPQKFTKRYPRTVQIISKLNDPQAFIKRLIENPPYVESFTIPTWQANRLENGKMKTALQNLIYEDIATMEKRTGKKFGDSDRPLLVSARSGARRSMPGMMDTILNVGLNSQLVKELAQKNPEMARFWYDAYRRLLSMFGDVVLEMGKKPFEHALEHKKESLGFKDDTQLTTEHLKELCKEYLGLIHQAGKQFPEDPKVQVVMASEAVFKSWHNDRAIFAREQDGIPHDWGTAVNICEMVFGNISEMSGTGVLMSRNNKTGEKKEILQGTVLFNAQGEDVVAGVRNSSPLDALKNHTNPKLQNIYSQLEILSVFMEESARDMQDIEFTIEERKGEPYLFILQKRNGKRSAIAEYQIAVDLAKEGLISKEEAILRIDPNRLSEIKNPLFSEKSLKETKALGKGIAASPGAEFGRIVFTQDEVLAMVIEDKDKPKEQKRKMILVTEMTSQEDIKGMKAADAILTSKGTEVSHAAVMATGWGKCCVVGLESINFKKNSEGKIEGFELGGEHFAAGQVISVDGHSGKIFKGELERIVPEGLPEVVRTILDWTTAVPNQLQIRANSEAGEAQMAWDNGARGIGLFRTEHAFTEEGRLPIIQEILFSGKTEDQLTEELNLLKQFHKEDFKKVLTINNGYGVTIRLLDAPLHEFAPKDKPGLGHEENPMLGFRSSRMGIMIPSIYAMQARAIFESTAELIEEGLNPHPEIELPLIIEANEIKVLKEIIEKVHAKVATEYGLEKIPYRLGTMIETPAAALSGEEIAKVLGKQGFASFGTNDMHQTTLALSRDDTSKVIDYYVQKKIMERSPFISLHTKVEKLIKIFLDDVRKPNADFEVFVCGEHGGDAYSIARFHALGLTGISMSPNRVEAARIKAAQEAIKTNMKQKSGDEPSQQKKKQTAKTNKKAPVKKHKK